MIVLATTDGFTVTDQANYAEFHVEVGTLSHSEFMEAVASSDDVMPGDRPRHLWVSTEFLHRQLDTANNPGALAGLEGMLRYAVTKGWINDVGTHVSAHVVVPK
ncbi:hypothetical protein ACXIZN_25240 [Amycolatopsis sp. TRM77291]